MKLTYFQGDPPNFGDELNAWIWNSVLPEGFLDEDTDVLFLGIGSIIQDIYPTDARKVVFGSGFSAGYANVPDVHDGTWDIRFVRGAETCTALGLPTEFAITDAAVLLRAVDLPPPTPGLGPAFMPHYVSVERGDWQKVCDLAGVHFIDPTKDTRAILADIQGASVVVAEAMHGAIVADVLRTPWIGVQTMHHIHRKKWFDWAGSLGIDFRPALLQPSNGREAWAFHTGRYGSGPGARAVFDHWTFRPINHLLARRAAQSMRRLLRSTPSLSDADKIEEATTRVLAEVDALINDYGVRAKASRA